jgi:septum formation protein
MRFKTYKLLLASQSPRRREILRSAGFECMTLPSNSSESFDENLTLDENLSLVAERKVEAVLHKLSYRKYKGILILGADTVVVAGKQVLGKPKNRAQARRMLRLLSGKTHYVKTSFSIFCPDEARGVTRVVTTKVRFRRLSSEEIQWYVDTGEPFDKAGGYAVQGQAMQFVNLVDGDLLNVVGLPLAEFKHELRRQRWNVTRRKGHRSSSKRSRKNRAG